MKPKKKSTEPTQKKDNSATRRKGSVAPKKNTPTVAERKAARRSNRVSSSQIRARNITIRQEGVRDTIQAHKILSNIADDYTTLGELIDLVEKAKSTPKNPQGFSATLAKVDQQTKILKVRLDTNFKLLNKILPDYKHIELVDPGTANPVLRYANALKQALALGVDD